MSVRSYLARCYVITVAILLLLGPLLSRDGDINLATWIIFAPFLAAGHVYIQIWVFARNVHEERRRGFWSYKWTSAIYIAFPAALLLLIYLAWLWDVLMGS